MIPTLMAAVMIFPLVIILVLGLALIKANQIGSLSETLLATRIAKDKGLSLVVSHRSKSPNEVMEADIAGYARIAQSTPT